MEWVEITAKTIEEARELAIDKLGVDESEVEVEVLEEPKQGLFGRVRGQARLRARVEPRQPRAKNDKRDSRRKRNSSNKRSVGHGSKRSGAKSSGDQSESSSNKSEPRRTQPRRESVEQESASVEEVRETVSKFLTGLVGAFGYESGVTIPEEDDLVAANVDGKHGLMVGPKARTLDAIQELTRVVAQRSAPSAVRIRLDVGGYRETRKASLQQFAVELAERSASESVEIVLEPMSSADRKTLHDALGEQDGVTTRSAGSEPRRRVIVVPGSEEGDE